MSDEQKIQKLREALLLAVAHIGWCWDQIEHHTRLRRVGSVDLHKQLTDALVDTGEKS